MSGANAGLAQETIGQRIRRLRKARGWTQYELAAEAEVTRYSLLRWEAGTKPQSFESFVRVADALGVSLDELYRGSR